MTYYFEYIFPPNGNLEISESVHSEELVNAIAEELKCEIGDLGFCSLYESDFTEDEIIDFENTIIGEETENFFQEGDFDSGFSWLTRILHDFFGELVAESSSSKFGGTVTNYWKKGT